MIEIEHLDLFSCFHCKLAFDSYDEVLYISSGIYDMKYKILDCHYVDTVYGKVYRRISFHKRCFENIAGSKYTP